jgi:D-methionine transport system permease protein
MLGMALLFTVLAGLPVGVLLYLTAPGALLARPRLYAALSLAINLLRSLPFIILLIVMIPLTLQLVGTSLGVAGAIPPLVAAAAPFFARLAENTLREVDPGVVEASQAMGAPASTGVQGAAARSPARPDRRHHRDRGGPGVLHRHVRRDRRRRPG